MVERISIRDGSFFSSYYDHIQRYEFALGYCKAKAVLDAGCGIGYGAYFLARGGARSVLAVDISHDALEEARLKYSHPVVTHELQDVETLVTDTTFDVVVNFENLEHLEHPAHFIQNVSNVLREGGVFITSTPNGAIGDMTEDGKPANPFHVKEYTKEELDTLLSKFADVEFFGQWVTAAGLLRQRRNIELHRQISELYFHPLARVWRMMKVLLGKTCAAVPESAAPDVLPGDVEIAPLGDPPVPWAPQVLVAVCTK